MSALAKEPGRNPQYGTPPTYPQPTATAAGQPHSMPHREPHAPGLTGLVALRPTKLLVASPRKHSGATPGACTQMASICIDFLSRALGVTGSLEEPGAGGPDPEFQASKHDGPNSKSDALPGKAQAPDPLAEFDEYGTELHKDARVWKVYVNEADKHDVELVNGWNESTDVILIFAALFSAISTAFLIESSKLLQPDPAEESVRSLLAISQTLSAIANGTLSPGSVSPPSSDPVEFIPSRAAVCVNVLWYLSLGLSLATSFIAILAKDWCSSFMRGRTGHPYSQMSRRQQKWDMIVKWKMSELLTVLPSLIHLALLLFSVGLCIYLSDMHAVVAIPIFCATGAAVIFYIWSSVAAISMDHFPYPTIISRVCPTDIARHAARATYVFACRFASHPTIRHLYQIALIFVFAVVWVLKKSLYIPAVPCALLYGLKDPLDNFDAYLTRSPPLPQLLAIPLFKSFRYLVWYPAHAALELIREIYDYLESAEDSLGSRVSDATWGLEWKEWDEKVADQAGGDKNRQNDVTSFALSWLITNCEDPQSVDIALQSIAGATSQTRRQPLLDCHATLEILRRLASSSLYKGSDIRTNTIVSLYSRALAQLGNKAGSASGIEPHGIGSELEGLIWDVHLESEKRVAALIVSGRFDPTPANLDVLRIGNTAASNALKLLRRDSQKTNIDLGKMLGSIVSRFESHVNQSDPLHDAALLSLANATALLLPFAADPSAVTPLVSLCVRAIESQSDASTLSNLLLINLVVTCVSMPSQPAGPGSLGSLDSRSSLQAVVGRLVDCYTGQTAILKFRSTFALEILATQLEAHQLASPELSVQDAMLKLAASSIHKLYSYFSLANQEETGTNNPEDDMLGPLGAIQSPLSLVLVEPSRTFIPFLILGPIRHLWWETRSPTDDKWAELASNSRFPTLSRTLIRLVEQSNFMSHLDNMTNKRDNMIKRDNIPHRFTALGQLWLLLTAYLDTSDDLADEREQLGNQLQRYAWSDSQSEHGRHARLGDELVLLWESGDVRSTALGAWPARLMECVYQSRNSPLPGNIYYQLREYNIPGDLRGLSSFTSWRPQPTNAETGDEPQSANDMHVAVHDMNVSQIEQPVTTTASGGGRTGHEAGDTGAAGPISLGDGREVVCEGPESENPRHGITDSAEMFTSEGDPTTTEGPRVGDTGSTTGQPTAEPGDVGNGADDEPHVSIDIPASDGASK